MEINKDETATILGEKFGFLFSYLLFTAILFFILRFLRRIPYHWTYFHIMVITLAITLTGLALKRYLR